MAAVKIKKKVKKVASDGNGNGDSDLMSLIAKAERALKKVADAVQGELEHFPEKGKGLAPQEVFERRQALDALAKIASAPAGAVGKAINEHALAGGKFEPGRYTALVETKTRINPSWKDWGIEFGKQALGMTAEGVEEYVREREEAKVSKSVKIVETTT